MSRRTGRMLALAFLLALAVAAPAAANGTLTVSKAPVASAGTVTGSRVNAGVDDPGGPLQVINCGATCSASLFDYETCIVKPDRRRVLHHAQPGGDARAVARHRLVVHRVDRVVHRHGRVQAGDERQ